MVVHCMRPGGLTIPSSRIFFEKVIVAKVVRNFPAKVVRNFPAKVVRNFPAKVVRNFL